ncbi:MAG: ATP synthase subunit I [Planctomycetota bacterium]
MTDVLWLVAALVAGGLIGLVYYGGLWLTVRRLPQSRHPAALSFGSFVVRMALAAVGFWLVMGDRWERAVVALAGALVVRTVLVHRLSPRNRPGESQPAEEGEAA